MDTIPDFIKITNEESRLWHEELMELHGYPEEIRLEFRRSLKKIHDKWTDEKRLTWWKNNNRSHKII